MGAPMSEITDCMKEAVSHHQAGRLDRAVALYRMVLSQSPGHADALHLIGLVSHQQGRHHEAATQIQKAISNCSNVAAYHNNLGAAHRSCGRLPAAISAFQHAVSLEPDLGSAWINLLSVLSQTANEADIPTTLDDWVDRSKGCAQSLQQRAAYRYAQGDLDGSISDQVRIARVRPSDPVPLLQAAILAHEQGDDSYALEVFGVARERHYHHSQLGCSTVHSKLAHDAEQIEWLVSRGYVGEDWLARADEYRRVHQQLFSQDKGALIGRSFTPEIATRLGAWYNKPIHLVDSPAFAQGALGLGWSHEEVQAQYFASEPGVTWIDGLLRPEAIQQLRDFCMGSTIWSDFKYSGGYVGTSLVNGFASGLLLQIARELRQRLPDLLGPHPLRQMWAYKYDQELTGIGVHADSAAVNVNFWITPDEANLDSNSGGLRVWRKCAPLEWDFEDFNRRPEYLMRWVHETDAEEVIVPYRSNRAVMFDSNLVHRTDDFQFAPGYENRRINITMLFGDRGS